MINLELGQLYGCKNYKELLDAIDNLKSIGMSVEDHKFCWHCGTRIDGGAADV